MDINEQANFITTYIKYYKLIEEAKEPDELFWACDKFIDIIRKDPELAWLFIRRILETDNTVTIIKNLSAGPLEDLLVYHGDEFIDRVEEEAKKNPDFAKLLGGVWKNNINDKVWERIQKVCDRSWDK